MNFELSSNCVIAGGYSVLDGARNTTVNLTGSLAEQILAPIYVGSGHYIATTSCTQIASPDPTVPYSIATNPVVCSLETASNATNSVSTTTAGT